VAANNNPYDAFSFIVVIDSVPVASFSECILPAVSIEVIEYREGEDLENNIHKLPGLVKYGDLILKRGLSKSPSSMALWDWFSGFLQGKGRVTPLTVTLLDGQKNPLIQWSFANAWPVKYEAPVLNGKTSALAIEILEVAVEGMKVSVLGQRA
jgi:phage tail-like protein